MEERRELIRRRLPEVITEGDMRSVVLGLQHREPPLTFFQHLYRLREIEAVVQDRMTPGAQEYFDRQVEALRGHIEG